jgi:hypothetical protein
MAKGPATGEVLSTRALNRALLARQHLLERAPRSPLEAVEHLVGMQSQSPQAPYVGLWSRIAAFDPLALSAALDDRRVVRMGSLRGTLHLVSAADAPRLRALSQPVFDRHQTTGAFGRALDGVDRVELEARTRALLEDGPLTFAQLGDLLEPHFPGRDREALTIGARAVVPLVQVPPRGLWGRSGAAAHVAADEWLAPTAATGRPVSREQGRPASEPASPEPGSPDDLAALLRRYLAAFGPASVKDAQKWSGRTRLGPIVERLRPDLVSFRDEHGVELLDLPDAPRPDPDAPAPVRFVTEFDNLLLSHADRSRILSEPQRRRVMSVNGIVLGTVLVDGVIAATWAVDRAPGVPRGSDAVTGAATVVVRPFVRLARGDRAELEAEGHRLAALLASANGDEPDTGSGGDLRLLPPEPL